MNDKTYPVDINGVHRELPIIKLDDKFSIASFVILGDCEIVVAAAQKMKDPLLVNVSSITTEGEQTLCLDGIDAETIKNKRVVIVDDVISTGASVKAIRKLAQSAGAEVVAEAAILTEGNPEEHKDVISLGNIPLFENKAL